MGGGHVVATSPGLAREPRFSLHLSWTRPSDNGHESKKSGENSMTESKSRQREKWVKFRADDNERLELKKRAAAYSLNVSSYLRFLALGDAALPDPGSGFSLTPEDRKQLVKLQHSLGNLQGNCNQISVSLHRGRQPHADHFSWALNEIMSLRTELRKILNRPEIDDRSRQLTQ